MKTIKLYGRWRIEVIEMTDLGQHFRICGIGSGAPTYLSTLGQIADVTDAEWQLRQEVSPASQWLNQGVWDWDGGLLSETATSDPHAGLIREFVFKANPAPNVRMAYINTIRVRLTNQEPSINPQIFGVNPYDFRGFAEEKRRDRKKPRRVTPTIHSKNRIQIESDKKPR